MLKVKVEDLKEGDLVDLESCPYMKDYQWAKWDMAIVSSVTKEFVARFNENRVVVSYRDIVCHIDTVDYPLGTVLEAVPRLPGTLQT
jgi:hypothetical protein